MSGAATPWRPAAAENRRPQHRGPLAGWKILSQATHAVAKVARAAIANENARNLVAAPVIYAMVVPIALLDASVTLYQAVCFRLWKIPQVARRDYVVVDRHRLPYFTSQKLNCAYCGYANGVMSYAGEIAARTEQYWCPINHATRVRRSHRRYRNFIDYGDTVEIEARMSACAKDCWPRAANATGLERSAINANRRF